MFEKYNMEKAREVFLGHYSSIVKQLELLLQTKMEVLKLPPNLRLRLQKTTIEEINAKIGRINIALANAYAVGSQIDDYLNLQKESLETSSLKKEIILRLAKDYPMVSMIAFKMYYRDDVLYTFL